MSRLTRSRSRSRREEEQEQEQEQEQQAQAQAQQQQQQQQRVAGAAHRRLPLLRLDHQALQLRTLAVGETVILLQPPLPLVDVSIVMERERQQNDSLGSGYPRRRCTGRCSASPRHLPAGSGFGLAVGETVILLTLSLHHC